MAVNCKRVWVGGLVGGLVWLVWGVAAIWFIYRIAKGWLNLNDNKPMPVQ